jgi:hypothetical protein
LINELRSGEHRARPAHKADEVGHVIGREMHAFLSDGGVVRQRISPA